MFPLKTSSPGSFNHSIQVLKKQANQHTIATFTVNTLYCNKKKQTTTTTRFLIAKMFDSSKHAFIVLQRKGCFFPKLSQSWNHMMAPKYKWKNEDSGATQGSLWLFHWQVVKCHSTCTTAAGKAGRRQILLYSCSSWGGQTCYTLHNSQKGELTFILLACFVNVSVFVPFVHCPNLRAMRTTVW